MMKQILLFLSQVLLVATAVASPNGEIVKSPKYKLTAGTPSVFEFKAPSSTLSVVFEDDGETGYFYALDYSLGKEPIIEAMHIYNVKSVADKSIPSVVKIVWSADAMKAGLWINDYPHAVFDFSGKRGYCRNNFPKPRAWSSHDFSWNDEALAFFRN